MGHIVKTATGGFRANWRDGSGRQKAKTFKTRKEATAYLAEVEASLARGTYIDPKAAKTKLRIVAERWQGGRNDEATTTARDRSIMRTHIIPEWGEAQLVKIDHSGVQAWVTRLEQHLAPETVRQCLRIFSAVLRLAVRDRMIPANPCEGVKVRARRRKDTEEQTISREALLSDLLPVVPELYRALPALSAGTGLRWGECVGLGWDAVNWDGWNRPCQAHGKAFCDGCWEGHHCTVAVVRVAVEVAGRVTIKPYPKSQAGRREVPLPGFVGRLLRQHRRLTRPGPHGEVFTNSAGGPLRRTLFRSRVWRPALVRAGLLGQLAEETEGIWRATWTDRRGLEQAGSFRKHHDAIAHVVKYATGGLRFHDLRHSYATWLVSNGVPINDVAAVMGHAQTSTTLNRYTHPSRERHQRVRSALADFSLTPDPSEDPDDEDGHSAIAV